jgi:DNA replication and repair protein RecF
LSYFWTKEFPVILNELSLINFKNYSEASIEVCSKVNCFVGNNGQGKTNVLDAIYYLAFCKSYFNPIDSQNIKHDDEFFVVQGGFDREGKPEKIFCGLKRGQKKQFKRNKKEYAKLSEHIGLIPLVMVSPSDSELILGGSETRRKFIDGVIAQFNPVYLDNLLNYQKSLTQRNALLKSFSENRYFDEDSLMIWDHKLAQYGEPVFKERNAFLEEFIPIFQEYYGLIAPENETVGLQYVTKLHEGVFLDLLLENRQKDRAIRYSSTGIHKDDLVFELGNHPMKRFGSQGQQKSYLLALKLAQFEYVKRKKTTKPMILLDDVFDKLDENRVEALIKLVSDPEFGQIFITDTSQERIEPILRKIGKEYRLYNVNEGAVELI